MEAKSDVTLSGEAPWQVRSEGSQIEERIEAGKFSVRGGRETPSRNIWSQKQEALRDEREKESGDVGREVGSGANQQGGR